MIRLFMVCALFGLHVVECSTDSNSSAPQNTNRQSAAVAPSVSETPTGQVERRPDVNTQELHTDTRSDGSDVTGGYFAKGTLPAEFSEIEHLSLAMIDNDGNPAPLNGFIRPRRRSAEDYRLVNPKLDGNNLTFSTATVNGVSYSFTGVFEKLGNFPVNPPEADETILRGTLTKMRDGKMAAETKADFRYEAGG